MTGRLLRLVTAAAEPPRERPLDLLEAWRSHMTASGYSLSTLDTYSKIINILLRESGVNDPLQLDQSDVIALLGRPVKQWTRITYWKAIDRWCKWLRSSGHDPSSNLIGNLPRPKAPAPVARPIDDATVERLLALKLPLRPHAYVRIALFEALRVHEIAKLRAEDFDLAAGWLSIAGKGGSTVPIPIHPQVLELADRMPEVGYWFPAWGKPSQPVNPTSVSTTIKAALRKAGSNATAHQLRDTAATRLQRTAKDIRLTQAMLRHRNLQSTMKYTLAANDDLQRAVGALDWSTRD